jgi:putative ABC transport system permease protein
VMVEQWWQDLQLAWRGLWRAKTFTGAAVLTLALGIAGTTVMFALIQGVLLRPLPVREQDRLILAWKEVRTSGSARYPFGSTEIEAVAEHSQLLEKAAGVTRNGVRRTVVTDNGVSTYANVGLITGGFFDVLGVKPALGRTLTIADDKEAAENVIVLSSGFWQRRYGASREVVGRPLMIGEQSFRIVGVMPPDLDYPTGVEVWRTTSSVPPTEPFALGRLEVNLVGRLRPGVTLEQAASEITTLSRRLDAVAPPSSLRNLVPVVRPFADVVVGDVRSAMLALFGAVGLVLLIASANVANLLLMRSEARRGELALRAALGAGRGRIVRQVLAESVVLAALAGVTGFAVTWWTLQPLVTLVPDGLPRVESVRIDAMVVVFSIAVVFLTALLAGLAPASLSMRADLVSQLRGGGHGITRSSATRGRRTLVVAQVALAVVVIAAAALLIQTVQRLQSVDLGLPVDRLVLLDLHIPQATYSDRRQHAQFLDEAIAQLEAVPGITAATPVNVSPFSGQGWDVPRFTAEGQNAGQAVANPSLNLESIHSNYFETFEVPIVRGRAFTAADREGAVQVAVVSEDVAVRIWPGENPIGRRLKMGGLGSQNPWYTVVGVAGQTRYREVVTPRPTLYLPAAQFQMTATMLVLRTTSSLELIASLARDRVRTVDRDVQVMRVAPFAEMLSRPLARPRFNAFLLSVFGIAALLLSTVGLYAVMAASVRQRHTEIGVRVALGASVSDVRRLILREGLWVAAVGAGIGLAGAMMTAGMLRSLLFGVHPLDPAAMVAAALLVVGAAAVACYLPAIRASRVDPLVALRRE